MFNEELEYKVAVNRLESFIVNDDPFTAGDTPWAFMCAIDAVFVMITHDKVVPPSVGHELQDYMATYKGRIHTYKLHDLSGDEIETLGWMSAKLRGMITVAALACGVKR